MKKITVIGANSYIARNIVYVLNQTPHEYDIKLYGNAENQVDGLSNYRSVNVLNKESVKQIDFNCDVVFMFVGKTGSTNGFTDYDTFIDINERALLNILNEYVIRKSTAKIIFPSTRLVYKGLPGKLEEDAEKEFKTIYAINKYACEQYLEMFHRVYDVQYCIFRICLPYGTLIPNASSYGTAEFMLKKATKGENITLYGDGNFRRTITYIGDLCNILIAGALSGKCHNDVFNVGGESYSLKEMAELIAEKHGVEIDYIPWPRVAERIESGDTVFDDKKLEQSITYSFEISFAEWIRMRERKP